MKTECTSVNGTLIFKGVGQSIVPKDEIDNINKSSGMKLLYELADHSIERFSPKSGAMRIHMDVKERNFGAGGTTADSRFTQVDPESTSTALDTPPGGTFVVYVHFNFHLQSCGLTKKTLDYNDDFKRIGYQEVVDKVENGFNKLSELTEDVTFVDGKMTVETYDFETTTETKQGKKVKMLFIKDSDEFAESTSFTLYDNS